MITWGSQLSTGRLRASCSSFTGGRTSISPPTRPVATWTRPTPDKDDDFIKPAYVPARPQEPIIQPYRREDQPLYSPPPEFRPAELPEKQKEMPQGPKMPERGPDPIPAGNPKKEKPPGEETEKREAPPPKKE